MASIRKISRATLGSFGDFSDGSFDISKLGEMENLKMSRSLTKVAPGPGRFLQRNATVGEKLFLSKEDADPGSGPRLSSRGPPPTASRLRANAVLTKLAQIETKIKSRKAPTSPADTDSDSRPTRDQLPRPAELPPQDTDRTFQKQGRESPGSGRSTRAGSGSRFLKKKGPPAADPAPEACPGRERNVQVPRPKEPAGKVDSPSSDEEEMEDLLGSLAESSREEAAYKDQGFTSGNVRLRPSSTASSGTLAGSWIRIEAAGTRIGTDMRCWHCRRVGPRPRPVQKFPSSKSSRPWRQRTSQPARGSGGQPTTPSPATPTAADTASRTSSPSALGAFAKPVPSETGRFELASSASSEAGPGRESPSEASEDSHSDFRINVLSLDDLGGAVSETSDVQEGEGARRDKPPGDRAHATPPAGKRAGPRPRASASPGNAPSAERGRDAPSTTASEISEHLGARSATASPEDSASRTPSSPGAPAEAAGGSAYSEDFESSPGPSASEPTAPSPETADRTLDSLSELSSSLRTPPSRRRRGRHGPRVVVKETAVQTLDPALACPWAAAGMATIGPSLGGAYADPAPIASHVVSMDMLEALTAQRPAALALDELLRQQLSLTRSFVEASRHLHATLLQSLDSHSFHYHTLEEVKEYIRRHRPARLTMEDALQEVREEL
ncbi:uncharacterized protein C19orf44 homolog [Lepus europaeus]|uniref:uncharacterized protein C19orf44 homolog n=1 Tax=Lepus europaeus TaxID=9983 RepID=UPI002B47EBC0|nr:uncharacterized protein C19orf44 homolog [Lepus europaeus]